MNKHLNTNHHAWIAIAILSLWYVLGGAAYWFRLPLYEGQLVGPGDPDVWLRLALVRDWMQSGEWYSHLVARSGAPSDTTISPWTRPLDVVIASIAWLQPEAVDLSMRLMRAALLLPWIWMTLFFAGICRIIRHLCPLPSAYYMAALLVFLIPPVTNYFGIGNADHHGLLAALGIWALGGVLLANPSPRTLWLSGILFALQCWVSVEALVLIGATYTWFGLRWLKGERDAAHALLHLAIPTALGVVVALMIERPIEAWFTPLYDSISIVHVVLLTGCAVLAVVLRYAPATHFRQRTLMAALGTSGLIAAISSLYPLALRGPMAEMPAYILTTFLNNISEVEPFYKLRGARLVATFLIPCCAFVLCLMPWLHRRWAFYPTRLSAALAWFIFVMLLFTLAQQRWSYYLLPLSIVVLAPILGAMMTPQHRVAMSRWPAQALAVLSPQQQMKRRLPVLMLLIGAPLLSMIADGFRSEIEHAVRQAIHPLMPSVSLTAHESPEATHRAEREACMDEARRLIRSDGLVNALPAAPQIVFAPTDIGTEILFFTPHRIIASNYHREGAGIEYLWEAETINNFADFRKTLAHRQVDYVLLCPTRRIFPGSVIESLLRGGPLPTWLAPVALPSLPRPPSTPPKHYVPPRVFRVIR